MKISHKYLVIRRNPNFALFCHLHLQNNSVFKVPNYIHVTFFQQSEKSHTFTENKAKKITLLK